MIDVKKLITGFLILATAAVCSGLIFSFVNSSLPSPTTNTAAGITIGGGTAGAQANNANAFLPTTDQLNEVITAVAPDLASSTMFVSSTDPSNLTDVLATNFVNGIVAANPNGPTTNSADGSAVIATPDVNAIAASVANTTTTQALQIPDWDVEAKSIPMTVVATSSATALTAYGNALSDILNTHLSADTQTQSIVGNQVGSASASDLNLFRIADTRRASRRCLIKSSLACRSISKKLDRRSLCIKKYA